VNNWNETVHPTWHHQAVFHALREWTEPVNGNITPLRASNLKHLISVCTKIGSSKRMFHDGLYNTEKERATCEMCLSVCQCHCAWHEAVHYRLMLWRLVTPATTSPTYLLTDRYVCRYVWATHSSDCSSVSRLISVTGSNRLSGSPMIPNLTTRH